MWVRVCCALIACEMISSVGRHSRIVADLTAAAVTAFVALALTSRQWKDWARRHRRSDLLAAVALCAVSATFWRQGLKPWTPAHAAMAAVALIAALAFAVLWRRFQRSLR